MGHTLIRVVPLDYMRGLMALAVLIFHYDKWLSGHWDASSPQGRLGVYAVSAFFVLSGLTLTLAYQNRLNASPNSWIAFFKKRFWRIFPLLWLATVATLLLDDAPRPAKVILLNFSGLFGLVNPALDVATGAWSIGCELVFYLLFPFLLLLGMQKRWMLSLVWGLLSVLAGWIAFVWFTPDKSEQHLWWEAYTQVANHAFFFAGGMVIAGYQKEAESAGRRFWLALMFGAVALFVLLPLPHQPFALIWGYHRWIFSVLTLLATAAFFYSNIQLKGWMHQSLAWLGAVSYSLYLLHPLVFRVFRAGANRFIPHLSAEGLFLFALLGTLAAAHVSYYFFEKPLLKR